MAKSDFINHIATLDIMRSFQLAIYLYLSTHYYEVYYSPLSLGFLSCMERSVSAYFIFFWPYKVKRRIFLAPLHQMTEQVCSLLSCVLLFFPPRRFLLILDFSLIYSLFLLSYTVLFSCRVSFGLFLSLDILYMHSHTQTDMDIRSLE